MKKNNGGFTLPGFKTYHKAKIIKEVCYWGKNTHIDQ